MRRYFRCLKALLILPVFLAATCHVAMAEPRVYVLDTEDSTVAFAWDFGQDEIKGSMPVVRADLSLDFSDVSQSAVSVTVDVTQAKAGFPFASQAMKGPKVLDAKSYPTIQFDSVAVRPTEKGAMVSGNITVRGVTRPLDLQAEFYRQRGTKPTDLSELAILLTGSLNRSDFGADGWANLAGDEVRLRILAYIKQADQT